MNLFSVSLSIYPLIGTYSSATGSATCTPCPAGALCRVKGDQVFIDLIKITQSIHVPGYNFQMPRVSFQAQSLLYEDCSEFYSFSDTFHLNKQQEQKRGFIVFHSLRSDLIFSIATFFTLVSNCQGRLLRIRARHCVRPAARERHDMIMRLSLPPNLTLFPLK